MTETTTSGHVELDIDFDAEVPCGASYHDKHGQGTATHRLRIGCPICTRRNREGNICIGCLTWFVMHKCSCYKNRGGCGAVLLGASFILDLRPL